jgi:multicomponent Na+:H+ antiporter subunit E
VNRLVPSFFALVVWLALWGEISVVNVAGGLLVVAILAVLFRPEPRAHRLHPIALVHLFAVFVWRLLSSSATVVVAVLAPTPARLRSGVVGVELTHPSTLVATIVADAISLTPGTLTLEARYADEGGTGDDEESPKTPPTLYIHVLGLSDPDAIRDDVRRLEQLVVSAVTPIGTGGSAGLTPARGSGPAPDESATKGAS